MAGDRLRLRDWLCTQALPLWGQAGWDARENMFVEGLDLSGRPLLDRPRRVMAQARQIYAFELAGRHGWAEECGALALRGAATMVERYYRVGGRPGWAFSVDRSGRPVDDRRDLYAHSFVLLALSSAYRRSRDRAWLDLAHETLEFLDAHMAGARGGYVESWPVPTLPRRQNPHMHLLEALLALHEVSGQPAFLDRATRLVDLCVTAFIQDGCVLAEHFDETFGPLGGPDLPFEPGHHFEWVWLLAEYRRLSGALGASGEMNVLWSTAMTHGLTDSGLVRGLARRGDAPAATMRLWSFAEASKAAGVMKPGSGLAERFLDALFDRFIAPAPAAGVWIEAFDEADNPSFDFAPASSLYHICCAFEALQATKGKAGAQGVDER